MKKTIILGLVALLAVSVVGPAAAKKKKPKPKPAPAAVSLQYFLRSDEACEAPFLSLTDGEDSDCVYGDTGFSPVWDAAGEDFSSYYAAADGLPLVFDTSRKITGSMSIRGWNGTGVGNAEVNIALIATIAGEEKEIGTYTESYTAGPQHVQNVVFEMTIDPALAGVTVEGLTLAVDANGTTLGGRGVEHDDAVPSVTIPALK